MCEKVIELSTDIVSNSNESDEYEWKAPMEWKQRWKLMCFTEFRAASSYADSIVYYLIIVRAAGKVWYAIEQPHSHTVEWEQNFFLSHADWMDKMNEEK